MRLRPSRVVAGLAVTTTMLVSAIFGLAPAANAADCRLVALKSGDYYVSAEFGWDGHGGAMLRARATAIGPWEQFEQCSYGNYWVFEAAGADPQIKFVSTEKDYQSGDYGMLRARADDVGTWEQYSLIQVRNGVFALKARANDKYVTVERQYVGDRFGMLRARSDSIDTWQEFQIFAL
jgi:hypothetical protein